MALDNNVAMRRNKLISLAHGGGRVVSASGVSSSTPASATIYNAYTSIIKKKLISPAQEVGRVVNVSFS